MRVFSFPLLAAIVFMAASVAASRPDQPVVSKMTSSNNAHSTPSLFVTESGVAEKRSLRVRGADDSDHTSTKLKGGEERTGLFDTVPSIKKIMRELDMSEENATIVRSIAKGHAPDKTLAKVGVYPSFVTYDGQKVYNKNGEGYKNYLAWAKWMRDNYNL
ncbi:hypothetical protein PHYBOEH_003881 [Phytophthora boehmeriae]|uniref:RxLR effector protein n=1 Tax=Phytophthora boehmeriae TaxID=109152 RepID=A0A8T1WQ89_9STRA|nr:hypothetical protein PHYBOEH_003881 [Phytophthora boehmeriae]